MSTLFEWLIKLIFILLLAPCFLSLAIALVSAALWAFLPWLIGLTILIAVTSSAVAALVLRSRVAPFAERVPPGRISPTKRPRGTRGDR